MSKMADILRAMDVYVEHDGGVEELARDETHDANERPTHGASCTCDACMDRDERLFTVWHDDEPAPVTCHKCGAAVEPDALRAQTMADGALMWPEPFCRACLMAGLRRLDAELKRQPGKDGDA